MDATALAVAQEALGFAVVAALWGCTNPLIKKYSTGESFFGDLRRGNWRVVVLFLLNQLGSVANLNLLFTQALVRQPVCNALTCLFTAVTAVWIGEPHHSLLAIALGCVCILAGTAAMLYDDVDDTARASVIAEDVVALPSEL